MAVTMQPSFQPKVRFEWISESWQLFVANAGPWVLATFIVGLICVIVSYGCLFAFGVMPVIFAHALHPDPTASPFYIYTLPGYWASTLINWFVASFFLCGLVRMALAQLRGEQISVGMLFQVSPAVLPFMGYYFIAGIAIGVATVACILPGCVVAALLMPGYAMVADGIPVGEALNRSAKAVSQDWLQGSLFALSFGLIYLASCIPCGLGALATAPMLMLICCLMYRDMIGMPGGIGQAAPNYYQPSAPGVWPPSPGTQTATGYPPAPPSSNRYAPSSPVYPEAMHGHIEPQQQATPPSYPPVVDPDEMGTSTPEEPV